MCARSESALIKSHQETNRASARIITFRRSPRGLRFHKGSDVAVQIELVAVDGEIRGPRIAFGKKLSCDPTAVGLAFGKIDHRLLGAPKIKRSDTPRDGLANRLHVCIGILIE